MDKLERAHQLKEWLKKSQEELQKEYEKRYSRINLKPIEAEEPVVDQHEPEMFIRLHSCGNSYPICGKVHFDLEDVVSEYLPTIFNDKGIYKLVKIK